MIHAARANGGGLTHLIPGTRDVALCGHQPKGARGCWLWNSRGSRLCNTCVCGRMPKVTPLEWPAVTRIRETREAYRLARERCDDLTVAVGQGWVPQDDPEEAQRALDAAHEAYIAACDAWDPYNPEW
jgi:hypothetical protein